MQAGCLVTMNKAASKSNVHPYCVIQNADRIPGKPTRYINIHINVIHRLVMSWIAIGTNSIDLPSHTYLHTGSPPPLPPHSTTSGYMFADYIGKAATLDTAFDAVVIKGRARPQVALAVLPLLRSDESVLIMPNWTMDERKYYHVIEQVRITPSVSSIYVCIYIPALLLTSRLGVTL